MAEVVGLGEGSGEPTVTLCLTQALMPQGQTQETLQSQAHPPSQIVLSSLGGGVVDANQGWRHVALFLAVLEVWGWAERPILPWSMFSLCPRHYSTPSGCGSTSHVCCPWTHICRHIYVSLYRNSSTCVASWF